jgi:hypothetical protein
VILCTEGGHLTSPLPSRDNRRTQGNFPALSEIQVLDLCISIGLLHEEPPA